VSLLNPTRLVGGYRMVERYLKFHASLVEIVDDGNAVGREIASWFLFFFKNGMAKSALVM